MAKAGKLPTPKKIHHATVAKWAELGVKLQAENDVQTGRITKYIAIVDNEGFEHTDLDISTNTAQLALDLGEYPALSLVQEINGDVTLVYTDYSDEEHEGDEIGTYDMTDLPTVAEILELCASQEIDPSVGPKPIRSTVIVSEHYRKEYKARGNENHCGDWLAKAMEDAFGTPFNWEAFTECLIANDVEMTGKWASLPTSGQNGWVGRYRMNGRQKLEQRVVKTGIFHLNGVALKADRDWLEMKAEKHPKITPDWLEIEAE